MKLLFEIRWWTLFMFIFAAEGAAAQTGALGQAPDEQPLFSYNFENCEAEGVEEEFFHKGLFFPDGDLVLRGMGILQPLEVVGTASVVAYQADQRLQFRFFLSEQGQFLGPMQKSYNSPGEVATFSEITHKFIGGVARQMEEAIDRGFAQWVSYLDMGHIHLNLPGEVLENEIIKDELPGNDFQSQILSHPDLLALYHVAEKVDFYLGSKTVIPNQKARFLSRNLLGKPFENDPLEVRIATAAHTVKANSYSIPPDNQYKQTGSTIFFQGNKNGCFQIQTKKGPINFDMSFQMPHSDPEAMAMNSGK